MGLLELTIVDMGGPQLLHDALEWTGRFLI
jgi:hypothetical protein